MAIQEPSERVKLSFTFASESTKQVLTLATTILAFTVTFHNDIAQNAASSDQPWLWIAWILLAISIVAGVWTYLAMTGTIGTSGATLDVYRAGIRVPGAVQLLAF